MKCVNIKLLDILDCFHYILNAPCMCLGLTEFFLFTALLTILDAVNSEIFARILLSRMAFKRHICDVRNSRQRHNLPISVNDRVIGFYFHETSDMRSFAKIKHSLKFPNLQ